MDLGSVNAPPPLDHRDSGVGWSSERSEREEKSYKPQASSLTSGTIPDTKNLERKNYEKEKRN
jgi:hypothetical protein